MIGPKPAGRFSELLQDELQKRGVPAPVRRFQRGEIIFRQGDPPDGIYIVLEGRVSISIGVGQSRERVLATFEGMDFFGEMAVIDDDRRSASATAAEDCRLLCVSRDLLASIMEQSTTVVGALLREFSQRLRGFDKQHVHELQDAERIAMLGQFTRSIIHDLKNPLSTISMASEIFGSKTASAEARHQSLHLINQQVDRVVRMLDEILRVTEGGRPEKLESANFAAYISRTVGEILPEFERKGIILELDPPPAVTLMLNPERLSHVFFNLCNNAADFMPGGGRIFIRFAQSDEAIVTEVEDTGPGIKPEIAKKLFTPFFTHGKASGTGLGLTICKNIIEDHGGTIWSRPEEGRGAIFCFSLPVPE